MARARDSVPCCGSISSLCCSRKPKLNKKDVALLEKFAQHRGDGNFATCISMMSEGAVWSTIYEEQICGPRKILEWMEIEGKAGRRNVDQGPWMQDEGASKYKRDMKVMFSSKATHDVIQTATIKDGKIALIGVRPKYSALGVALKFASARENQDDELALKQMSDKVEWKAWDGFHVEGKAGVRKLLHEQKGREVAREGKTEFEAAAVNEQGGVFERLLDIERVDGIKVRTKQRLFVKGELTELEPLRLNTNNVKPIWGVVPKIVEVHVLTTEEQIDGKWTKSKEDDHF